MAITDLKFASGDFTGEDIAGLSDRPSSDGLTAAQLKARFDNIGKNMVALGRFNDLIDALQAATDGDAGADNIAVTTITGAAGTTVQGVLETIAADNFVTTAKIADGQVTLQKMAANSVDSDQYVDGSIDTAHYAAGSVDATALASDAVTTAKILNANVTNEKLANITRGSVKVGGASNAPTDLDASGDGKILIGDGTDINSVSVSGDITIDNAGAVTIANKAVTLAKMNDMATASLIGRKTAETGVPEVLSKSDALTLLNVEDGANAYVHPSINHIPADGASGNFLKYASAGTAQWAAHGLVGSDIPLTGYTEAETNAPIAATDTINEAFGKAQKQISDTDAALGDRQYTEQNYVTDAESLTASVDALDMALNDTDVAVAALDARVDATELQNYNQQLELNDIERTIALMNPTQSTRVDITSAAQTVALPKTAGIGPVKPTIKGLTATNLVTNGDFSNGTTGWGRIASISNKIATNTVPAGVDNHFISQNYAFRTGDKYYMSVRARVTNSDCQSLSIRAFATVVVNQVPVANQWYVLSGILTAGTETDIRVRHAYVDSTTALSKVMEVDGNYGVKVVNLTAIFGAGNEPNADTCALLFPTYFDGTQSAIAPRLRSANSDATETSSLYTEPLVLYRVPNGTADTIEQVNGVWNYVQRVKRYVLTADDITAISETIEFFDRVYLDNFLPDMFGYGTTDSFGTKMLTTVTTPRNNAGGDNAAFVWLHYFTATGLRMLISVPKGFYADLAAAKTALAGTVVYYQLATPIYTPISSSGVLQSYPSGTIYAEHALADAGLYTTSIGVLNTDFPIESLESLYIVHPITGVKTALDHTTATIAGDGLSFTHAGLTAGDIVFFTYFYAFSGVWGQNVYSHFDGSMVVADTDNSKFYSWKISSTNGVASIVLTEVT